MILLLPFLNPSLGNSTFVLILFLDDAADDNKKTFSLHFKNISWLYITNKKKVFTSFNNFHMFVIFFLLRPWHRFWND